MNMKKIVAILLVSVAIIGCASSSSLKKQDDKITIEYAAYTRGFSLETKATKVAISGYTRGRKESAVNKSTQSKDWRSLIDDLDKIGLDKNYLRIASKTETENKKIINALNNELS